MTRPLLGLATLMLIAGCPEASSDTPVDSGAPAIDSSMNEEDSSTPPLEDAGANDTGTAEDSAAPEDSGGGPIDAGAADELPGLVINEIDPDGEWTEIYNGASDPVALGGYRFTDSDAETGEPRPGEAATFPTDFELGPGEYLVLVETMPQETGLISNNCAFGDRCLHTAFGLSASNGDTVFILRPEGDDTVVRSMVLPAMTVEDGQSWCLLPNATGAPTTCDPTPDEANQALPEM